MARRFQESVLPSEKEVPINQRSVILSLPAIGLVLVGLIASGLLAVFPPFLRFLVVFAVFSYLSGEAVLRRLIPGPVRAWELRLPLAVFTGLSVFAVVSWVCWISGVSFRAYVVVLEVTGAGVLAASMWRARGSAGPSKPRRPLGGALSPRTAVLAVVSIGIAVLFLLFPPVVDPRGDSLDHVGYVRNIIAENRMEPEDVLAPAVFARAEPSRGDPRKGVLHPFIAAIATLSSNEPMQTWRFLPVVLAPLAVLAFAAFASTLLPSGAMVAVAVLLFLMFQGGIGTQFLGVIAYGQHLSLVFFWLLVVMALGHAPVPPLAPLVVIGLLCLGGGLVHIDVAVHAAVAYSGLLLFYRKLGFSTPGILRLGTAIAVGVVVAVVWKLFTAAPAANLMHAHPQGLLYFGDIGSRFFTASPIEIVRRNGLVFFTGLFLIPLLPLVGRSRRYGRFGWMSLALALPPIAVAFNPLAAPLVYEKGAYLLHRFVLNVPSFAITTLVLGAMVVWARSGNLWRKLVAVLILLAWSRPFLMSVNAWWLDTRALGAARYGAESVQGMREDLSDVIRLLNENVPANSVVMSDPLTSYVLSAFTSARVVAVLHQHGNPNDPYPMERLEAMHAVLSPFTGQNRMVYALRKFGVEYVVVNGAFRAPYHDYLAHWDPDVKRVLADKIGGFGQVFRTLYETEKIAVYRVIGTDFEKITWDPEIPFTRPVEVETSACGVETSENIRVVSVGADNRTVLPGERVTFAAVYRRLAGGLPRLPLVLRLRFEDRAYFDRSARYPGDKYVRRFLERWRGELWRFRVDRTPFSGYFSPREWPEEHGVCDIFDARLPMGLAEATYDVEAELVEETLLPNFTVRDLLFNEDSFDGSRCTEIDVRRHVVR